MSTLKGSVKIGENKSGIKAETGVEEAILKMLKRDGLISEGEYAKCIQAFHKL